MSPILAISSGVLAAIIAVVIVDLFAIAFGLSFVRTRRARRAAGVAPTERAAKPVSRRDFFRRSLLASFGVFAAQFGGGTVAFLWPNLKGGFGAVINAGKLEDIKSEIESTGEPYYFGAGRFYIVPYDGTPAPDADYEALGVTAQGIMPLYQRCVHLGCRVPFCKQSQWFECPCHGSKFNTAGEYELGPAPRGLDRFAVEITEAGDVMVDTSRIILGPPRGVDTLGKPQAGPFCVAPG